LKMLRPDSAAIHNAIILFLRGKVTKLAVTEKKEKIVTSPNEIADKLKIDRETAKKHLKEIINREINGVAIQVQIDGADVIIRDDPPSEKSGTKLPPQFSPQICSEMDHCWFHFSGNRFFDRICRKQEQSPLCRK
jgi:hypothetical protein